MELDELVEVTTEESEKLRREEVLGKMFVLYTLLLLLILINHSLKYSTTASISCKYSLEINCNLNHPNCSSMCEFLT